MRGSKMTGRHSSARTTSLKNLFRHVLNVCFLTAVLAGLTLIVSCDSDQDGAGGKTGTLQVRLAADTTSLKQGTVSPLTKTVGDEFANFVWVDDYQIHINKDDTVTVKSYERYDKMPADITLREGSYSLIAFKGKNLPAAFANPYFEGSVDFQIKENMHTPLDITCTLANARITTEYTKEFKEKYTGYTVLLSTSYTTEEFEIAPEETRAVYMQVAKKGSDMAIGVRLKKAPDEEEQTYYVPTPLTLQRRQNIRLIFKAEAEGGTTTEEGIGLTVVLDGEMEEMTLTTEIPDFMWQQFDKPTLTPEGFQSGDRFEFNSGLFADDPYIGVNMPAGIGSLCIKYWREGEEEDDAMVYDLATEAGAQAAREKHYTWTVGKETDIVTSGQKTAVVYLQQGLNSLPSSDDVTYTYHYQVYGTDANGKANVSNIVTFDADVLPAGAPQIVAVPGEAAYELVEGDELPADWKLSFTATGLIDHEATKVVVNDGGSDWTYAFMQDQGNALVQSFGAETEIINAAQATITFPKAFTTRLAAPSTGSKVYTFTFYLKDGNGKEYTLSKTVTVYAPVFTIETTADDAFARRIVFRAQTSDRENQKKLSFQYRPQGGLNWTSAGLSGVKPAVETTNGIGLHYVDTLKGLTPEAVYSVRAVYNANTPYARYSEERTVTTEKEQGFRNGKLMDPLEDWSIEPDANGSTAEGNPTKENAPKRCWEVWLPWSDAVATDWNTLNKKTTSEGGFYTNIFDTGRAWARYAANSGTSRTEGVSGYAALLRTVGWGRGNSASGGSSAIKYSNPGELYLGTYNGAPVYGIEFASRPSGFSFHYKYQQPMKGNDEFTAEIIIWDENGKKFTQQFTSSGQTSEWKEASVYLTYPQGAGKAKKMAIRFVSGKEGSYKYDDFQVKAGFGNLSDGEYTGSHLSIDNVKIIYE